MASRLGLRLAKSSRSYATAAQVKPPIALFGIDGKYASALFSAAAQKKVLDAVETDLKTAKFNLDKDSKLKMFLENPTLKMSDRKLGVQQLLRGAKPSDITKNFFDALSENGRLNETTKIIDAYLQLMQAHRGETQVTVTSADPLDKGVMDRISSLLNKSQLGSSGKLKVTNKVDQSILGGLLVEFGDKTIDLSVSSKINKLNKLLTDAI